MFPFFNEPGAVTLIGGLNVKREGLEMTTVYLLNLGITAFRVSR
jgi:hypothetical protein